MRQPDPNTTIDFSGPFREYLVAEYCRHNDLIWICNLEEMFNTHLEQTRGRSYLGTCPWCGQKEAFSLHSRTGAFRCTHCGAAGDYLDMLCLFFDSDLTFSVNFLFECISEDRRKRAEKRAAARRRRQSAGGAA